MQRIVTSRPSPALIVAVLALITALAGTALAGSGSGGLTNKKVKRIAAKQITKRAPTLSVASATTATNANTATHADAADRASSATSADQANSAITADNAANAAQLEGLGADAFARATQIDSGTGDNAATTQTPLVSFPDIGLEVRTDGDADTSNALRFVNSRATGTFLFWETGNPNSVGTLTPFGNVEVAGPAANQLNHDVVFALQAASGFDASTVVSVTCRFSVPPDVVCLGVRAR